MADAVTDIQEGAVRGVAGGRTVYPVLVVSEASLESFGINAHLNQIFQEMLGTSSNRLLIKPLTVMSIQELEGLLPYFQAGEATWHEILEKRFIEKDKVAWISIHQALYSLVSERKLQNRPNAFLKQGYDQIVNDMKTRFGWKEDDS